MPGVSWFRRINPRVLIVSLVIGAGLTLIVLGVSSGITGSEAYKLPDEVEEVDPVPGAVRVPSQTRVFVDLLTGYTGVLIIDGLELPTVDLGEVNKDAAPGEQVTVPPVVVFEPGNNTLTFVPTEGAAIEEFSQGEHQATVVYWKIDEGRTASQAFTWTFNVF
jgi:hypothetical protein